MACYLLALSIDSLNDYSRLARELSRSEEGQVVVQILVKKRLVKGACLLSPLESLSLCVLVLKCLLHGLILLRLPCVICTDGLKSVL